MNWGMIGGITLGLGALLLLGAGLLGGGAWVLSNQPAGASIPPLASAGAASPALGGAPTQQPTPAPQAAPAPQDDTPKPDAVPKGCDPEAPCAMGCCPSGFDCGGPCKEGIPLSQRFQLRYGGGGDGKVSLERLVPGGKLCVTVSGTTRRMCVPLTEGDVTLKTRLPITAGDFARGMDVQVYDAKGKLIANRMRYSQSFLRGIVCKGFLMKGFSGDARVQLISFFLDPGGQAPRRCDGKRLSFGQE